MADKIIRFRWPIIIGFTLITLFFGWQVPRAKIQTDFETYIPEDVPARVNTAALDDIFGGSDVVMILLETDDVLNPATLQRVQAISRRVNRIRGVDQVLSLFDSKDIRGEDGMMIVEPAVKRIPKTAAQTAQLRDALRNNDLVYELVVSTDFSMTAVILTLDETIDDRTIIAAIDAIIAATPGTESVRIGGMPETRLSLQQDIARDFIFLMPLALVLMVLTLLLTFRQLRGVLLPFTVVIMSILFGMGLQVLIGWEMTILSILLPVMLIAIANNYGIHLVAKYQELNAGDGFKSREELVKNVYSSLSIPILLTGLTTIAGILGLLSHVMIPAKRLGIMAAAGIAYALLLSLFFLPALMSLLKRPKSKLVKRQSQRIGFDKGLLRSGKFVARHPGRIITAVLLLSVVLTIGITYLKVDSNIINFFPKNHATRQTAQIINAHFGGSETMAVMVTGDIRDPALLQRLDRYATELENLPDVGNVTSLATVVLAISRAMNDPADPGYDKIPDSRAAVAQYLELYNMSGDPEDFEKIVDFNYENAQMIISMRNPDASAIKGVIDAVENITAGDPAIRFFGGASLVTAELADIVVKGQMLSLAVAIVVIAIMMMLMFRNVTAGLLAAIPLIVAVNLVFGLMGYLGIRLDIATAMLSSIMIGVGVDYTIHFLWRYRQERQEGQDYGEAVIRTLTTTGRGIAFNALSVILGFGALMVSLFPPIKFFGFLVVMSIFSCVVGALILVPALCLVFKPRFLEPQMISKN